MNESFKKPVPENIVNLIAQFKRDYDLIKTCHEEYIRQNYINPFFNELGWDLYEKRGLREVIPEDRITIEGKSKAPDYGFYINDIRQFFLEAKRTTLKLSKGTEADKSALQLRRYGWSASLHVSILTNFEELVIYNCRVKPQKDDFASKARIKYYTFEQYLDNWTEIYELLSRQSVAEGKLEKYVEQEKDKTFVKSDIIPVDDDFLQVIERWREGLAYSLSKRNALSVYELNFAVQTLINRIVFLRICEDLGIEPYQVLLKTAETKHYQALCKLFREADNRYNSGLFHFTREKNRREPDELTLRLKVDESYLYEIIKEIYTPNSPYEFSVIPVELLGHIYEQFLGKIIVLNRKNEVSVEDKLEVRKAGGVYYTPDYIVNYIVEQTVGKVLEGKNPKQIENIRILDPACGSGSFLVGAYSYLLNWHCKYYKKDKLTAQEKKRILLNNIYGVDIDRQAVEVTKLSLLLKVLEGETEKSIDREKALFKERILPDLDNNIKCGNSLIGSDFYDNEQNDILDEELRHRINVFDWESEDGFGEIMKAGGFDIVIGNPPYVDSEWMTKYLSDSRRYCASHYQTASGNWDIFCIFIEKAVKLCKKEGLNSLIIPNKLGSANYAIEARRIVSVENSLISIRDYSHIRVFPVSVYPIIYVLKKTIPLQDDFFQYERMKNVDEYSEKQHIQCANFSNPEKPWAIFSNIHTDNIIKHLQSNFQKIHSLAHVLGAATVSEAYEIKHLIKENLDTDTKDLKVINSGTIDRYHILWGQKPFRYLKSSYLYPVILNNEKELLPKKRLAQAEQKKIIIAGMTKTLECVIDYEGIFLAGKSTSIVVSSSLNLKYLLGLLNSRLITFYYQTIFGGNKLQGEYLRVGPPQLRSIPIRTIDFENSTDKANHDKMVKLVDRMLILHKQLDNAKISQDKILIQRQIDKTDKEINQLVYQLYELTPEEIEIVEK